VTENTDRYYDCYTNWAVSFQGTGRAVDFYNLKKKNTILRHPV